MVRFDGKAHDPIHVDVSVRDRRDMHRMFGWVPGGLGFNCALHRCGIPGQHDIGEQGESTTDGVRIILGPAMFGLDPPGQQSALQGVERFTLGEQSMNLAAEFGIDQIVEHEHAAHDFADQGAAFIDRIPARCAAMALDDGGGRTISALERSRDVLEAVLAFARRAAKRDISSVAAVNYGTATADRIPAVTSILAADNSQIVRIHGIFTTNLMERGFTDGEVKMAQSVLRVAAERHRLVASILSDPYDRAIINQYADEVEGLSRLEVTAERSPGTDAPETRLMEIGGVLGKIFKPEPSFLFDELIEALDVLASPPPWKPL